MASRLNRDGTPFNILMLDLDRFKTINDTLGHAAGDELLRQVARRLRDIVRESDVVARLGGDEFAIIQVGPRDDETGLRPASSSARRRANSPIASWPWRASRSTSTARSFKSGASIGVALAPRDGTDPDDLLRKADVALYAAKSAGRNAYRIFDHADARRRPNCAISSSWKCGSGSTAKNSCCTTSRSSIRRRARCGRSRRWCGGIIRGSG